MSRAWAELQEATVLKHEADGFTFEYVKPSGLALNAMGIIAASDLLTAPRNAQGKLDEAAIRKASELTVMGIFASTEKQDALLIGCMVKPRLCPTGQPTDGCIEVQLLGQYRDELVLALINALGHTSQEVEAVRFPGEASAVPADHADGESGGEASRRDPGASGRKVRAQRRDL